MKKLLLTAALALTCVSLISPRAHAQTGSFTFTAVSPLTITTNQAFVFDITLTVSGLVGGDNMAPGAQDLAGLSYWLRQTSPAGAPFGFSITGRANTSAQGAPSDSPFTDYIQGNALVTSSNAGNNLVDADANERDLGALVTETDPPTFLGNGTYFVARITLTPTAVGTYTIQSGTIGGRTSRFNDGNGDTADISPASLTITVVPEPSTYALLALGMIGTGVVVYRRRRALA